MAAIAPIKTTVIPNGTVTTTSATVGIDRTFNPAGFPAPGVVKWVDRAGGIPVGYPALTLSLRPPTKGSRNYKVQAKLALPTLEQTSASTATGIQPAPTKAYDCTAILELILPERSTGTERMNLLWTLMSLFAVTIQASDGSPSDATGSPLFTMVEHLEAPY